MNKANIRLMGMLCPKNKLKTRNLLDVYQWILIVSLVFFVSCLSLAQEVAVQNVPPVAKASSVDNETEITPLKIGDKIPDELWETSLKLWSAAENTTETITLNDYKGKVIILDFWATWCTSCISGFPAMLNYENEFAGDLKVFPFTYQNSEELSAFFDKTKSNIIQEVKNEFSSIVDYGKLKDKYFPSRTIPHVAVIDKEGIVRGVMLPEQLNSSLIKKMINNDENVQFSNKRESSFERPLLGPNYPELFEYGKTYYSMFTGILEGYVGLPINEVDTIKGVRRYMKRGLDVVGFYSNVLKGNSTPFPLPNCVSRRVLLVKDPSRYTAYTQANGVFSTSDTDWKRNNMFAYEAILPSKMTEDEFLIKYLSDIDIFFGLQGRLEIIEMPVLLLKSNDNLQRVTEPRGNQKGNKSTTDNDQVSIVSFVRALNGIGMKPPQYGYMPFVFNETGYEGSIKLEVTGNRKDFTALKKTLSLQGLDLVEETRRIEMFVLREVGYTPESEKLKFTPLGYVPESSSLPLNIYSTFNFQ